jgi:hypothetical protein
MSFAAGSAVAGALITRPFPRNAALLSQTQQQPSGLPLRPARHRPRRAPVRPKEDCVRGRGTVAAMCHIPSTLLRQRAKTSSRTSPAHPDCLDTASAPAWARIDHASLRASIACRIARGTPERACITSGPEAVAGAQLRAQLPCRRRLTRAGARSPLWTPHTICLRGPERCAPAHE